ncbi:MAG: hypothetical protein IKS90_02885 [Clostridia bacterium]|nr:hypothetical protein [Clostridia bacterium]
MKTETIVIEKNGTNAPWEGCVNSVNYRIERGVAVEVPCEVARLIRQSAAAKKASSSLITQFTFGLGKKL